MPYILRGHTGAGGNSAGVTSPALDCTGADLITVGVGGYSAGGVVTGTLSDSSGNTWTPLTRQFTGAANELAAGIFYCRNPIVSTNQTFSFLGAETYCSIAVAAWSGSAPSPFDQENGATTEAAGTTVATGIVTPTQNNELVLTITGQAGATTAGTAISAGFIILQDIPYLAAAPHYGVALAYQIQTTAAAANPTWTYFPSGVTRALAACIATFKAAPAAVTGTGALAAQPSTVSGTGTIIAAAITGTGALVAQRAIVAGAGVSRSTGTGIIAAGTASLAGVGAVRSTGTGVLAAQSATLAGIGAAQGAGMGVLAAQSATLSGTGSIGLATVSGAGTLTAGAALVAGTGVVLAVATGQGALVAGQASLSATGTSETTGAGALAARAALVTGQYLFTAGAGALNAGRATVAGIGTTTGDSISVDFEGDLVDVIGPLVGGRAYPNTYPQDCIWPAIRYTLVSVEPYDDLCSHAEAEDGTETADVRVQFDLVAETYTQSRDLRVAMRKAMRRFDPPALMSAEFNTYDVETKVHRVVMDYVFYPSSD